MVEYRRLLDDGCPELEAALEVADRWPDDAVAQNCLGAALAGPRVDTTGGVGVDVGWAEAESRLRRAIDLAPSWAAPCSNLAGLLGMQGRAEQADALHRRALVLGPADAAVHDAYGITLRWRGELDAAEGHLRRALALDPGSPSAASTLANILLLRGEFEAAWRVHGRALPRRLRPARAALWGAEELDGREIFVHANDGLGDALMLARYATLVAERGGHVILGSPATLAGLLAGAAGVAEAVATDEEPVPRVGTYLPMSLLPYVFRTTPATIPASVPYLRPDAGHARRWAAWLAEEGSELKVGLVWGGSRGNAHNWARSIPLAALAPLGRVPGVRYYALQQGPPLAEARTPPAGLHLTILDRAIADYGDTAAIAAGLDLVISVDSSPAHLAGALGRPVWLLTCAANDWFWGMSGDRTPWYPSMRLFRQATTGDWAPVVAPVADALRRLAASHALDPANLGALPLCGLRGVDERGAYVSWLPERTSPSARS